jgi:hypothetical protein
LDAVADRILPSSEGRAGVTGSLVGFVDEHLIAGQKEATLVVGDSLRVQCSHGNSAGICK